MKKAIIFGIFLNSIAMNSQTIITQDFEAPLVGWVTNGTVTNTQNSVTPVSGSAMLSLGASDYIESPNFSLPAGSKYVSFWLNSYLTGYDITIKLYQNNLQVLTLGTFQNNNAQWSLKNINIPAGYSGGGYTILFDVVPNAVGSLRYYLDDIKVEVGQAPTSILENNQLLDGVSVDQKFGSENTLVFKTSVFPLNIDFKLFDIQGRTCYSANNLEILSNEQNLTIPHVEEGLYILRLQKDNKSFEKKVLLK